MVYTIGFGYYLKMGAYTLANPTRGASDIAKHFFPNRDVADLHSVMNDISDMRSGWSKSSASTNKRRLDHLDIIGERGESPQWSNNNWVYVPPSPALEPEPPVHVPTKGSTIPATDAGNDQDNGKGQGIFCWVTIGGKDVSENVISMKAEINSSISGGAPTATCDIVLHNNHQEYGHLIAARTSWLPNRTPIIALVYNYKNTVVDGLSTILERKAYVFFYGVMSQATFDATTCTIKCTSIDGSTQQAHFEDRVFQPGTKAVDVISDIMSKPIEELTGLTPVFIDTKTYKEVLTKITISSLQSSIAAADVAATEFGFWVYNNVQKEGGPPEILLLTDDYEIELMPLDPYVTKQGFTMSTQGHANKVDVIVNCPTAPTGKHPDIPASTSGKENHVMLTNTESETLYGKINFWSQKSGNMAGGESNAIAKAMNTLVKLDARIDNKIEATVLGIIPYVWGLVTYTITDGLHGENNIVITAKVAKESIEYSSKGLLTHLTMTRLQNKMTAAIATATPTKPPVPIIPEIKYPIMSNKYYGNGMEHQAKMDATGTMYYMSTGIMNDDGSYNIVGTVINESTWITQSTNVPSDILTTINNEISANRSAMLNG